MLVRWWFLVAPYLGAFATVGQLTLVTFDRGLRAKVKSAILLG